MPLLLIPLTGLVLASGLSAQTDYFNTDANRPLRIEDAYPLERYAFEVQLAPLRLSRTDGGEYRVLLDPEIAWGLLPRTYVELGLPFEYIDEEDDDSRFGIAGLDLSIFYNLNTETRTVPALALAAGLLLPVGSEAPEHIYPSVTGIVTRSFRFARVHANAQYTFGEESDRGEGNGAARWLAGIAVDKPFPLKSALLGFDVFAEEPLEESSETRWVVEAGARYQLDPFLTFDLGIGRTFTGDEGWHITIGATRAFAIRALMPPRRR